MTNDNNQKGKFCQLCDGFYNAKHSCFNPVNPLEVPTFSLNHTPAQSPKPDVEFIERLKRIRENHKAVIQPDQQIGFLLDYISELEQSEKDYASAENIIKNQYEAALTALREELKSWEELATKKDERFTEQALKHQFDLTARDLEIAELEKTVAHMESQLKVDKRDSE